MPSNPDPGPQRHEQPTVTTLPSEARSIRGYRLLQTLGRGAYGVVYRALSPGGVEVAIKEILYPATQMESQREFEALQLLTTLRHPYLLSLHDFWTDQNQLFIAMELADSSLAEMARHYANRAIPAAKLVPIFAEAAEALDYLHENKVLHRDIKPANILMLRGHAKVADLGLAKHNPDTVGQTQTIAGTPAFMAPETFDNQLRAASDQYGLALCYAELRLGRQLCDATSYLQAMIWHVEKIPNLEGLEPWEQKALHRALAKQPEQRFETCRAFVDALKPPPPPAPPAPVRSRWPMALSAAAVGLPLLAVLAWLTLWPKPPWDPKNGFEKSSDARVVSISGQRFYDQLVKKVGAEEVVFRLIPPTAADRRDGDPPPFYIMENKVWNGLFKVAAGIDGSPGDPEFLDRLAALKRQYPTIEEWSEWRKGGLKKDQENLGVSDNDLPVMRVLPLEAYCFALWLHPNFGHLPTKAQWLTAAGKSLGRIGPFESESVNGLRLGDVEGMPDVAVGRFQMGPLAKGTAKLDYSRFGIRDMAGNGREWTSTLYGGGEFPPAPGVDVERKHVVVLGSRYSADTVPFQFDILSMHDDPTDLFGETRPEVGFRVVLNPNP